MRRHLLGRLVILVGLLGYIFAQENAITFLEPNSVSQSTNLEKVSTTEAVSKTISKDSGRDSLQMLDTKITSGNDRIPAKAAATAMTTATSSATAATSNAVPNDKLQWSAAKAKDSTLQPNLSTSQVVTPAQTQKIEPSPSILSSMENTLPSSPASSTAVPSQVTSNYVITEEIRARHQMAYEMLQKKYAPTDVESLKSPFDDVLVAYHIALGSIVPSFPSFATQQRSAPPVLYSAGKVNFVGIAMAALGMPVHVFECTSTEEAAPQANIYYHSWCLGVDTSNTVVDANLGDMAKKTKDVKSIQETLTTLGHKSIDILTLDMGGHEWDIIQKDILNQDLFLSVKNNEIIRPESMPLKVEIAASKAASTAAFTSVANTTPSTEVTFLEVSPKKSSLATNNNVGTSNTARSAESATRESVAQTLGQSASSPAQLEMLDIKKTDTAPQMSGSRYLRDGGVTTIGGATVKKIEFVLGDNDNNNNSNVTATTVASSDAAVASSLPISKTSLDTTASSASISVASTAASETPAVSNILPDQLLFELHTKGSKPFLQDKDRNAVNRLFAALWYVGYRVVYKAIKPEDTTVAMFTLLRLPSKLLPPVTDVTLVMNNNLESGTNAENIASTAVPSVRSGTTATTVVSEPSSVQFLNTVATSTTPSGTTVTTAVTTDNTSPKKQGDRIGGQSDQLQFLPAAATPSQVQFLNVQHSTATTATAAAVASIPQPLSPIPIAAATEQVQFLSTSVVPATTASSTASTASTVARKAVTSSQQVQFLDIKSTDNAAVTPTTSISAPAVASAAVEFLTTTETVAAKKVAASAVEEENAKLVEMLTINNVEAQKIAPVTSSTSAVTAAKELQFLKPSQQRYLRC